MKSFALAVALWIVAATAVVAAQSAIADVRARDRIKALENLPPIAVDVHPDMRVQAMTVAELATLLSAALNREVKGLTLLDRVDAAQARAELHVVTAREGGRVQLSIYRPVRIASVTEEIVAPVWSDARLILRGVNRTIIRESIASLVSAFAKDYAQAQKQRQ